MGKRMGRVKVRKLVGWDKDNLIGIVHKSKWKKKEKKKIHSFPPADRCLTVSRKTRLHHVEWLLGKTNILTLHGTSFSFFPCAFIAELDAVWYGLTLWSDEVSCPSCVTSMFLCTPRLLVYGVEWEKQKPSLTLCKHCSATAKTVMC